MLQASWHILIVLFGLTVRHWLAICAASSQASHHFICQDREKLSWKWLAGLPWASEVGKVVVQELDWYNSDQLGKALALGPFYSLIAADCIYNEEHLEAFRDTCLALMDKKTSCEPSSSSEPRAIGILLPTWEPIIAFNQRWWGMHCWQRTTPRSGCIRALCKCSRATPAFGHIAKHKNPVSWNWFSAHPSHIHRNWAGTEHHLLSHQIEVSCL